MNPEYIYILSNPSLPYLKIGRTKNKPEFRTFDLSKSTSIPTDFILEYWDECKNSHICEEQIHEKLNLYRVSDSKEFFDIDLNLACETISNTIDFCNKNYGTYEEELKKYEIKTKNIPIELKSRSYKIVKIKNKTSSKFFKQLEKGDNITFSLKLKNTRAGWQNYALYLTVRCKKKNIETKISQNNLYNRLKNFELRELNKSK